MADETTTYQMTNARPENYWIAPDALYITLNAMGQPDYLQGNVSSGAVIMCYMRGIDGLSFDAGHNYRRWPLAVSPTYFNTSTPKYVYAAIPKSEAVNAYAQIVYPSEKIDLYGKNTNGEQIGVEGYYFVFLQGIISASVATDGTTQMRSWTQRVDCGSLASDEAIAAGGMDAWWKYSSVDDTVTFLKTIAKAVFDNITAKIATISKLVLGGKPLTGVAEYPKTSSNSETDVVTPKYVSDRGEKEYLSKTKDDETTHKLTMGEAEVTGNATVEGSNTTKGNASVGGDLDVGGSATVHGDLAIGPDGSYSITKDGVAKLAGAMADYLKSKDFSAGTGKGFDGTGYGITKDPATGKYTLEVDNLIARMKMVVAQLEVNEMSFIGGTVVMSACGNRMLFVEPLDAEGSIVADTSTTAPDRYRCYFLATDGDQSVGNRWTVGQLARCQTNNITAAGEYTNYENRDYWRLVVGVSSAPVEKDGKTCHWIDISNSTSGSISLTDASGTMHVVTIGGVSATMNSAPRENDCIIGMGHQWDDQRQDVAIVSASGWVLYKGIDHYDLPKANIINKFGIDEVIVTSDHYSLRPYAQPDDVQTALCYRGPYADGNWYGRGDLVSHIRRMWLCVVKLGDKITGQAPSDGSPYWVAYSDKAADVLSVTRSGNGLVRLDAPDVITLAIRDMYGNDVTADYTITVNRDSGNATADSQWSKSNGTLAKPWKLTIRPADLTEAALSGSIPFTISCRHTTDPANNPDITRTISEALDSTRQLHIAFQSDKGSFVLASAVNVKLTGRILYGDDDYTARFLADPRTEWTWSRDSGNAEADKGWKPKTGDTPNILSIEHHYKDPYTRADCGPEWRERLQVSYTLTAKVYIDATDAASATTITATVKIGS